MYQKPHIEQRRRNARRWKQVAYQEDMRYQIPAQLAPILKRTGGTYLGEDENFYYWMESGATDQLGGMFDNIGNMFKRMVKFTPKSFTPGNIYKGFVNTALTTATSGLYQVLPKNLKKAVYDVGKIAIPVVAGGVLAVTAGPAVMAVIGPKLIGAGAILGKAASTIGGPLMGLLGKLPQNKQAEVAQRLTPEDIAYMERYNQVPPYLNPYFDALGQQTFNPPMAPPMGSSGSASLYSPMGPPPEPGPEVAQAGMFGNIDPMMLALLIGVPAVFFLFQKK